jgi:hypothetical protein
MEKETVRISLFNEMGDNSWTIPAAIEWLQDLLETIPEEYREDSTFEVEYESDYDGGGDAYTRVYYDRPETDEEVVARIADSQARAARARLEQEQRERAAYAALHQKYGS